MMKMGGWCKAVSIAFAAASTTCHHHHHLPSQGARAGCGQGGLVGRVEATTHTTLTTHRQ